jgi:hypothetical protein
MIAAQLETAATLQINSANLVKMQALRRAPSNGLVPASRVVNYKRMSPVTA